MARFARVFAGMRMVRLSHDGLSYSPINPSAGQHTYSVKNVDVKGCEKVVLPPKLL